MIIHRGTLTLDKLKELAKEHLGHEGDDHTYNPAKNHDAISILKETDGNYRGKMWKNGELKSARSNDPQILLQELITCA